VKSVFEKLSEGIKKAVEEIKIEEETKAWASVTKAQE
jgi:hypothetical protein